MPERSPSSERLLGGQGPAVGAERPSGLVFDYDPHVAVGPFVPGEALGDRYRYERTLSEGGMAVVVGAQHVGLGERVAMKFMKPAFLSHGELVARFAREAKTTARLRSEHTVKVLDVGVDRRRGPFLVMEYLEGRDLKAVLEGEAPLAGERVAEIAIQTCDALAAAHAQGVVHRDVKPDNIFLLRRGGVESVRVIDFGISKATLTGSMWSADAPLVRTARLLGSPAYMSPEQMRSSASVDARSDIWSLGVTLYEALCGEPPFSASSITEVCALVLEGEPRPVHERNPGVERGLADLVMRCLRKSPDERPQTVAELAVALSPYAPSSTRSLVERIVGALTPEAGSLSLTPPEPRASWHPPPSAPALPVPPRGTGRHGALAETMSELSFEGASGSNSVDAMASAFDPVLRRRRRLGAALASVGGVSLLCSSFMVLRGEVEPARAPAGARAPSAAIEPSRVESPPEPSAAPVEAPAVTAEPASSASRPRPKAPRPANVHESQGRVEASAPGGAASAGGSAVRVGDAPTSPGERGATSRPREAAGGP
jgi:serine/threonine-protein kinase